MSIISSKDVNEIIRKTLSIINPKIMNHGDVTGYILFKMLECEQRYTEQELVDYTMLGILHDIGLYKESNVKNVADFETKNLWPHSIYGFLFLKYLSPMGDKAEIVLYHHLDYNKHGMIQSRMCRSGLIHILSRPRNSRKWFWHTRLWKEISLFPICAVLIRFIP